MTLALHGAFRGGHDRRRDIAALDLAHLVEGGERRDRGDNLVVFSHLGVGELIFNRQDGNRPGQRLVRVLGLDLSQALVAAGVVLDLGVVEVERPGELGGQWIRLLPGLSCTIHAILNRSDIGSSIASDSPLRIISSILRACLREIRPISTRSLIDSCADRSITRCSIARRPQCFGLVRCGLTQISQHRFADSGELLRGLGAGRGAHRAGFVIAGRDLGELSGDCLCAQLACLDHGILGQRSCRACGSQDRSRCLEPTGCHGSTQKACSAGLNRTLVPRRVDARDLVHRNVAGNLALAFLNELFRTFPRNILQAVQRVQSACKRTGLEASHQLAGQHSPRGRNQASGNASVSSQGQLSLVMALPLVPHVPVFRALHQIGLGHRHDLLLGLAHRRATLGQANQGRHSPLCFPSHHSLSCLARQALGGDLCCGTGCPNAFGRQTHGDQRAHAFGPQRAQHHRVIGIVRDDVSHSPRLLAEPRADAAVPDIGGVSVLRQIGLISGLGVLAFQIGFDVLLNPTLLHQIRLEALCPFRGPVQAHREVRRDSRGIKQETRRRISKRRQTNSRTAKGVGEPHAKINGRVPGSLSTRPLRCFQLVHIEVGLPKACPVLFRLKAILDGIGDRIEKDVLHLGPLAQSRALLNRRGQHPLLHRRAVDRHLLEAAVLHAGLLGRHQRRVCSRSCQSLAHPHTSKERFLHGRVIARSHGSCGNRRRGRLCRGAKGQRHVFGQDGGRAISHQITPRSERKRQETQGSPAILEEVLCKVHRAGLHLSQALGLASSRWIGSLAGPLYRPDKV